MDGALQTAEHVLCRHLQNQFPADVVIAKFSEEKGILELKSDTDLRSIDKTQLGNEVNQILQQNLPVTIKNIPRSQADALYDTKRLPSNLSEIRIVSIGEFDARPCKDPHVKNTKECGTLSIDKIKRVGNNRYRFTFTNRKMA